MARLRRKPGGIVHGVFWRLTPRDLAALNAYENVAVGSTCGGRCC